MQEQNKPLFLIKKYYSILKASIAVETAAFLITLLDSLIAGNMIGSETLIAVGAVAPLLPIVDFLRSMINSGTLLFYNSYIGNNDKEHADDVFSQGLLLTILTGILIALGMLAGKNAYIGSLSLSESVKQYTADYYSMILIYLAMEPLSSLLANMLMSDGGERLSAAANIAEIICNIVLSILFAKLFGIHGIAMASILSKLLFFTIIGRWAFRKIRSVRLTLRLKLRICRDILSNGFVRASKYIFTALMQYVLILYVTANFGEDTLMLLSVAIKMLGMSGLFLGLSMAAQPLITILRGERNFWGLKSLMKTAAWTMFLIGISLSLLTVLFAPLLIRGFGLEDQVLLKQGTVMMRCMGLSFAFQSLATFYFLYAFLMRKNALALLIVALNEFLAPVGLALLGVMITHLPTGLWIGIALAPVIGFSLSLLAALALYGKENFPWLVSENQDEQIMCYDFEITEENATALSQTLFRLFGDQGYSSRTRSLAGMLSEDILMLIKEKNPPGKKLFAECNVIFEKSGARVILRDSGIVFDVTACDGTHSLQEYIVAQTLNLSENKFYISTTGYNRNELLLEFRDKSEAINE